MAEQENYLPITCIKQEAFQMFGFSERKMKVAKIEGNTVYIDSDIIESFAVSDEDLKQFEVGKEYWFKA